MAEQMIRAQFDWPYGHLMQADALLALERLVSASSAYQLALHLMVVAEPPDDLGRAEVMHLCQQVAERIAQHCCSTLTLAHNAEVTSIAAWPPLVPLWDSRQRRQREDSRMQFRSVLSRCVNDSGKMLECNSGWWPCCCVFGYGQTLKCSSGQCTRSVVFLLTKQSG